MSGLYDTDFYGWAQEQATLLNRLAAEQTDLPIDLIHLAEAVEDMGNEVYRAFRSHLMQILVHLIKIAAVDNQRLQKKWSAEVTAFHHALRNCATGAILHKYAQPEGRRNRRPLDADWEAAVSIASDHLQSYGDPVPTLPEACPISPQDLLADRVEWPALIARLRVRSGA